MDDVKRIGRELKFAGSILDVYSDRMLMANGNEADWDYVAHRKGAACVLPVLPNGHVLMVRQNRPAIERVTLEIPAGAKDTKDEPSETCAARELEEETGYRAGSMSLLCKVATTVAFCNEQLDVYLATDLIPTEQHLDDNEFLSVEEWDIHELIQMIYDYKIQDSKTSVALLTYYSKYVLEN